MNQPAGFNVLVFFRCLFGVCSSENGCKQTQSKHICVSKHWGAVHCCSTRGQQTPSLLETNWFCTTQVWNTSYIWVSESWEVRKSDFNPSVRCSISSVTDHTVGGIPKKRFKNTHKKNKTVISLLAVTSTVNALGSFERNTDDTGTKWLCWDSPINREQGQTKSCKLLLTDFQWFLWPSDTWRLRLEMNMWPVTGGIKPTMT